MENSTIFTPCQIGPITLRNRVIRSAAFENMAYGNRPSDDLLNYHEAVARGGVGMTTVAYAAFNRSGISFDVAVQQLVGVIFRGIRREKKQLYFRFMFCQPRRDSL